MTEIQEKAVKIALRSYGDGCMSDFFEEALFCKSEERANGELSTFDKPENFSILEVNMTYEF